MLLKLHRSRSVIENDFITKFRFHTGPQAITGSTRMQATTISTFIIGTFLEQAIYNLLSKVLTESELLSIGFYNNSLEEKLLSFEET